MKTDIEARRKAYFRDKPERTFLFLLLIALVVWAGLHYGTRKRESADTWAETYGVIDSTEIVPRLDLNKPYAKPWELVISYTYTVNGTNYSGNVYSLAGNLKSGYLDDLSDVSREYPPGTTVKVYYDPNDHHYAVLAK